MTDSGSCDHSALDTNGLPLPEVTDDPRRFSIVPDATFSQDLSTNPASAAQALWDLTRRDTTPRNIRTKTALTAKLCSIVHAVLKQPAMRRVQLLRFPFVDAVLEVILDEESYRDLGGGQACGDAGFVNADDKASVVSSSQISVFDSRDSPPARAFCTWR